MSRLRQFFSVLFRREPLSPHDDPLDAEFEIAQARLSAAQTDFSRVIREVLDQNERLRANAKRAQPRQSSSP